MVALEKGVAETGAIPYLLGASIFPRNRMKKIILATICCFSLAGCSAVSSGPSKHTIKYLIAQNGWNHLVQTDRMVQDIPRDVRTARESRVLAILDHAVHHKNKYMQRAERRISQVSCVKASDASYHCSARLKIPDSPIKNVEFSIERYGNYWEYK